MSIFQRLTVTPSRIAGLLETLTLLPVGGVSEDELESMMMPAALRKEGKEDGPGETWKELLAESNAMGFIVREEGKVLLSEAAKKQFRKGWGRAGALQLIAERFLDPECERQREFQSAAAWLLSLSPLDAPAEYESLLTSHEAVIGPLKLNASRFNVLRVWLPPLGLGWTHRSGKRDSFVPDPTNFLRARLGHLLGSGKNSIPVDVVVSRIGEVCPLLEHGSVRDAIKNICPPPEAKHISPSVSFAFLRLRDARLIELVSSPDANAFILDIDQSVVDKISHLRLTQAGVAYIRGGAAA